MERKSYMEENRQDNKGSRITLKAACAAAVVLIAGGAYMAGTHNNVRAVTVKDYPSSSMTVDVGNEAGEASTEDEMPDLSNMSVALTGLPDQTIREGEELTLVNSPDNKDISIVFTVYDENGDAIYQSDPVPEGEVTSFDPSEKLDPGEHNLSIYEQPILHYGDSKTIPLTSGTCNTKVTIQ